MYLSGWHVHKDLVNPFTTMYEIWIKPVMAAVPPKWSYYQCLNFRQLFQQHTLQITYRIKHSNSYLTNMQRVCVCVLFKITLTHYIHQTDVDLLWFMYAIFPICRVYMCHNNCARSLTIHIPRRLYFLIKMSTKRHVVVVDPHAHIHCPTLE